MQEVLLILLLVVSVALIAVILLQQSKGAEMGASFGAGASATVFGAAGAGNFLTRLTSILATLFFAIALGLGYLSAHPTESETLFSGQVENEAPVVEETPVLDASDVPVLEAESVPAEVPVQPEPIEQKPAS